VLFLCIRRLAEMTLLGTPSWKETDRVCARDVADQICLASSNVILFISPSSMARQALRENDGSITRSENMFPIPHSLSTRGKESDDTRTLNPLSAFPFLTVYN
jgi:hypothetical protein